MQFPNRFTPLNLCNMCVVGNCMYGRRAIHCITNGRTIFATVPQFWRDCLLQRDGDDRSEVVRVWGLRKIQLSSSSAGFAGGPSTTPRSGLRSQEFAVHEFWSVRHGAIRDIRAVLTLCCMKNYSGFFGRNVHASATKFPRTLTTTNLAFHSAAFDHSTSVFPRCVWRHNFV